MEIRRSLTTHQYTISWYRPLGYTPRWTGQLRVTYEFEIADVGTVTLASDLSYRDDMYVDSPIDTTSDFATRAFAEAVTTWDMQVAFTSPDAHWRVGLEGRNLGNEREPVNTFTVTNFMTGGYLRERTWALSLGYEF